MSPEGQPTPKSTPGAEKRPWPATCIRHCLHQGGASPPVPDQRQEVRAISGAVSGDSGRLWLRSLGPKRTTVCTPPVGQRERGGGSRRPPRHLQEPYAPPAPATTPTGAIEIDHPRAPHAKGRVIINPNSWSSLCPCPLMGAFRPQVRLGIRAESASTWTWRNFRTEFESAAWPDGHAGGREHGGSLGQSRTV